MRCDLAEGGGRPGIALDGDATTDATAFTDLAKLGAARLDLTGSLSASDGGALIQLVGLDRLVVADKGAGRLEFKARGALDDPMTVDARIAAGGLNMSADGTLRLPIGRTATASLALAVAKARYDRKVTEERARAVARNAYVTSRRSSASVRRNSGTRSRKLRRSAASPMRDAPTRRPSRASPSACAAPARSPVAASASAWTRRANVARKADPPSAS